MRMCLRTNCVSVVSCWSHKVNGNKLYSTNSPSKHLEKSVTNSYLWNLSGNLFQYGSLSFLFKGRITSYNWSGNI